MGQLHNCKQSCKSLIGLMRMGPILGLASEFGGVSHKAGARACARNTRTHASTHARTQIPRHMHVELSLVACWSALCSYMHAKIAGI